jgi:hypothetical protein
MESTLKTELWSEFGATIDMFENAIAKCPDSLWDGEDKFWYKAFHTLFFLDYYLDTDPANFKTSEPFGMTEAEIDEIMPSRTFTKDELLAYVKHCRKKRVSWLQDLLTKHDGKMERSIQGLRNV